MLHKTHCRKCITVCIKSTQYIKYNPEWFTLTKTRSSVIYKRLEKMVCIWITRMSLLKSNISWNKTQSSFYKPAISALFMAHNTFMQHNLRTEAWMLMAWDWIFQHHCISPSQGTMLECLHLQCSVIQYFTQFKAFLGSVRIQYLQFAWRESSLLVSADDFIILVCTFSENTIIFGVCTRCVSHLKCNH